MVDYTTNSHTVYLSSSLQATEELRVNGTFTYNMSDGGLDEVMMDTAEVHARIAEIQGAPALTHQDFSFTEMHEYSNLDYAMFQVAVGIQYQIAPRVTLTADGSYADLTDDAPYVYGDETGNFYVIRTGVRFGF